MKPLVKTTGSSGVHVYVPIVRGPVQKQVWTFAKALAQQLAAEHPKLLTAEYRVPARVAQVGDLWKPLRAARGRFKLEPLL